MTVLSPRPQIELHHDPYRHYIVDGVESPGVTDIGDVIHREALIGWAMNTGRDAVTTLVTRAFSPEWPDLTVAMVLDAIVDPDVTALKELITGHELSSTQKRDKGGGRGTAIHEGMRRYFQQGTAIVDEDYDAEATPFAQSLRYFIEDHDPTPILCETPVASREFGYAGTPDLLCWIDGPLRGVGAKWGCPYALRDEPKYLYLLDFKTSKQVYPAQNFPQLAAYKQAVAECGHLMPEMEAVIRLAGGPRKLKTGKRYQTAYSNATLADFLSIYDTWRVVKRLKSTTMEATSDD